MRLYRRRVTIAAALLVCVLVITLAPAVPASADPTTPPSAPKAELWNYATGKYLAFVDPYLLQLQTNPPYDMFGEWSNDQWGNLTGGYMGHLQTGPTEAPRCLDYVDNKVTISTCDAGTTNQQDWQIVTYPYSDGRMLIESRSQGLCLSANDTSAVLDGCSDTDPKQQWAYNPAPAPIILQNVSTGEYLRPLDNEGILSPDVILYSSSQRLRGDPRTGFWGDDSNGGEVPVHSGYIGQIHAFPNSPFECLESDDLGAFAGCGDANDPPGRWGVWGNANGPGYFIANPAMGCLTRVLYQGQPAVVAETCSGTDSTQWWTFVTTTS
ncbi:hypothetical protein GCM10009765_76860 [Fodinicola feengrottensis]|uniref:Ricin B lectin domain-containing protein n=3 Tax=Fodinicola feengrottensis TaxID=435914 RepID=A0ABP4V5K6_9ACTN